MLKMTIEGVVSQIEERVSKKNNAYLVVKIVQGESWLSVMFEKSLRERALTLAVGSLFTAVLEYSPQYKSFIVVDFIV